MSCKNYLVGCLVLALLAIGYAASHGVGQDRQTDNKKIKPSAGQIKRSEEPAKAPTYLVEREPFKIEVTLKGVLEAEEMTPVALNLEAWPQSGGGSLTVQKAVEHGTQVRKGDTLLWLDLDRIDQAIRDLEAERQLTELTIQLTEKELPILERALPVDLAAAKRTQKIATEDLQKFAEKDRAFSEKSAEFSVKSSREFLEYAQEELRQLEKMYKASDLTEDTEQIILKRQRNYVERAAFSLTMSEKFRDDLLKVILPRRDQLLHEESEKSTIALEKANTTLPMLLNQKRLTRNKMKYDRDKTADRLTKLKRDREAMTVKSPADGLVYYGRCLRGQWTTAGAMADKLQRGGQVQPQEVIFTIVQPKSLFIRAEAEEKDLGYLWPGGIKAEAIATAYPEVKFRARIESASAVPVTPGKFLARVAIEIPQEAKPLMPGMACSVKFVPYVKPLALTVPASAVFTEELDEERHYVYMPGEEDKPIKRPVKVGKRTDRKAEILEGLKEGEEILLHKPGAEPKSAGPKKEEKEGKP
jgi:multidrug resistance efflux pump